jgi:hypothetical protein
MCGAERESVVSYADKLAHHVEKRAKKVKRCSTWDQADKMMTDWLAGWLAGWLTD